MTLQSKIQFIFTLKIQVLPFQKVGRLQKKKTIFFSVPGWGHQFHDDGIVQIQCGTGVTETRKVETRKVYEKYRTFSAAD